MKKYLLYPWDNDSLYIVIVKNDFHPLTKAYPIGLPPQNAHAKPDADERLTEAINAVLQNYMVAPSDIRQVLYVGRQGWTPVYDVAMDEVVTRQFVFHKATQ